MKKIYNSLFDETYYTHTLDNGLELIIFHKPAYSLTCACFGTPYGGLNIAQKLHDEEYRFNAGVAHFLEHKLFETEDRDIMNDFSILGANVNAFTSYKETVYYFSKSGDVKKCLELLLDFVQNLDISEESVEKEKGIICQELAMYMQNPDTRLLNETYRCLYKNHPLRYDIGGDEASVNRINKQKLMKCYALNYHPSNMKLVITTPLNPEDILAIVENNQKNKQFERRAEVENILSVEEDVVYKKQSDFEMDINSSKSCYAIKIKPNFSSEIDAYKKEWALRLYLNAYFSNLNPQYQKWLDDKLITDYFGFEVDFAKDYANIIFYIEGQNASILKEMVDSELQKKLFNADILAQCKRKYLGSSYRLFNDIEGFCSGYIRDLLEGLDLFEEINILMDLNYEEIIDIYHSFNYDNFALINIFPRGK